MKNHIQSPLAALVLFLTLILQSATAHAQGTAFTYNGKLNDGTNPATGSYDLSFKLYDAVTNGNAIGALTNTATGITNGLFAVTLDFGGVFNGSNYWLELAARTNGGGAFSTLSPRQPITPTPYAIFAANAGSAATATTAGSANSVSAANIVGTISLAQLPSSVVTNMGSGIVGWQTPSGATVQAQSNTGYVLTNAQLVTLTLPASPNIGDIVQVAGGGGWILAQNAGQWISGSFIPAWIITGAPSMNWSFIASSSDGTKLAAVVYGGGIYTSSNSGTNWTQRIAPTTNWVWIASSSDGTKLTAVVNGGGIYTSSNAGTNWTLQTGASSAYWNAIASSSDGTKLAAVVAGDGIYTSSNAGTNWTQQAGAPSAYWIAIASSSDGTKLAAVVNGGGIYTSSNSGTNWTQQIGAPSANWVDITSSSDGTKLAAVVGGGGIYTSSNSGTNWTQQTGAPSLSWNYIASSSDGTKLAATVYNSSGNGVIYTSSNSGTNWTQQAGVPPANWGPIASSSDGTQLVAAVNGGGIYITRNPSLTATTIGTTGFLQGAAGSSIQLIYVGGGNFVELSQAGTINNH